MQMSGQAQECKLLADPDLTFAKALATTKAMEMGECSAKNLHREPIDNFTWGCDCTCQSCDLSCVGQNSSNRYCQ